MEPKNHNRMNAIWPAVQAEINAARRRARAKRYTFAGSLLAAMTLFAFFSFHTHHTSNRIPQLPLASELWTMEGVVSRVGISQEYPLLQNDRIFIIQGHGAGQHVSCLSSQTGLPLWQSSESFQQCRLAENETGVYVLAMSGSSSWRLFALDPATGNTLWSHDTLSLPQFPPSLLITLGKGLCWSQGNEVIFCDTTTGTLSWKKPLDPGQPLSSPCFNGEELFLASAESLYSLNPQNGNILWRSGETREQGFMWGPRPLLTVEGSHVYVAANGSVNPNSLRCVDAGSHQVLWSQSLSSKPLSMQVVGNRLLMRGQNVQAYETTTGRQVWELPISGCGPITTSDDRVYLVDAQTQARVIAIEYQSGREVWHRQLAAACNGIVLNGWIGFLSGNNGILHAMNLKDPPSKLQPSA